MIDVCEIEAGAFTPHALEQAICSAIQIVAADDVRAAVKQFEDGRGRVAAGGKSEACGAVFQISDAALKAQLPDSTLKPFKVPDIPGATGWTGPDLHGNSIGQIYWTQGRCMMTIGLEVEGPRIERLVAGAKAIYERTGHTCPG